MPISFTLDNRVNLRGESRIRIDWHYKDVRYQTTIGLSIKRGDWKPEISRGIGGSINKASVSSAEFNRKIKFIQETVLHLENLVRLNKEKLSTEMMKEAVELSQRGICQTAQLAAEKILDKFSESNHLSKSIFYKDSDGAYYEEICVAKLYDNPSKQIAVLKPLSRRQQAIAIETEALYSAHSNFCRAEPH